MIVPYQIEAVAPGTSNAIRSHDHPMLESGNLSFPEGRYVLGSPAGRGSLLLRDYAPGPGSPAHLEAP